MFRPLTLDEANAFLPLVNERLKSIRKLVKEGHAIHEVIAAKAEKNKPGKAAWVKANIELVMQASEETLMTLNEDLSAVEDQIRDELLYLQQIGAIVKSISPGKVDFIAEKHKQPVYLCYSAGEKSITHWHPVDEAFESRHKITDPEAFGAHVAH